MQWHKEESARLENDSTILQNILDCNIELCNMLNVAKEEAPKSSQNNSTIELVVCVTITEVWFLLRARENSKPDCRLIPAVVCQTANTARVQPFFKLGIYLCCKYVPYV